jgi:SAM-dependent methyltransferase
MEPERDFADHFSEGAAGYAAHRPGYPSELVDFLADRAPARERAWDAGCGSGQLSVPLARRFQTVVATDASARQLARAEPHPRVDYRRRPSEDSGLPDGSVDLAVAAQAAHWFDMEAYSAEVRRVARPGGVVGLVTYGFLRVDEAVDDVLLRFYHEVLDGCWPPERRHVEEGYQSLHFPFRELDAPDLELRALWTPRDLLGYVRTWSAVSVLESREGTAPMNALQEDLARAWDGGERTIVWPLRLRLGQVGGP